MSPKPVYVDAPKTHATVIVKRPARRWGIRWSHLWTEPGNEEELHRIAEAAGQRRAWFQDKPGFPHYDVTPARRRAAIEAGAVPADLREWIRKRFNLKR